jgi:hypothetical protein
MRSSARPRRRHLHTLRLRLSQRRRHPHPKERPPQPVVTACAHCGYDLSAHAVPRCPECGNYTSPRRLTSSSISRIERAALWFCIALAILSTLPAAIGILGAVFTRTQPQLKLLHVLVPTLLLSGSVALWGAVNVWTNVNITLSRAFISLFALAIIYPVVTVITFLLLGNSIGFYIAFFACVTATALLLRLEALQAVIFTFFVLLILTCLLYILNQLHIIVL